MNSFQISRWNVSDNRWLGSIDVDASEDEIRTAFGLDTEEYPGDSITVPDSLHKWLTVRFGVKVNPKFEYTIDYVQNGGINRITFIDKTGPVR